MLCGCKSYENALPNLSVKYRCARKVFESATGKLSVRLSLNMVSPYRELGRQHSTVELDTKTMSTEQLQQLEEACNSAVRASTPVHVQEFFPGDPELEAVSSVSSSDIYSFP